MDAIRREISSGVSKSVKELGKKDSKSSTTCGFWGNGICFGGEPIGPKSIGRGEEEGGSGCIVWEGAGSRAGAFGSLFSAKSASASAGAGALIEAFSCMVIGGLPAVLSFFSGRSFFSLFSFLLFSLTSLPNAACAAFLFFLSMLIG